MEPSGSESAVDRGQKTAFFVAPGMQVPAYAIDDQTAIKVTDGTVEVVSAGTGSCLRPARKQANRAHETRAARLGQRSGNDA
jgi:hypothetical protein